MKRILLPLFFLGNPLIYAQQKDWVVRYND